MKEYFEDKCNNCTLNTYKIDDFGLGTDLACEIFMYLINGYELDDNEQIPSLVNRSSNSRIALYVPSPPLVPASALLKNEAAF